MMNPNYKITKSYLKKNDKHIENNQNEHKDEENNMNTNKELNQENK